MIVMMIVLMLTMIVMMRGMFNDDDDDDDLSYDDIHADGHDNDNNYAVFDPYNDN